MFIDEAEIIVQGGDGGSGKVAFFRNRKGPSGGNGGKGGDLYFVADQNIKDLKKYTQRPVFKAEDGQQGGQNRRIGSQGKDLILSVPVHTSLIDNKTGEEISLDDTVTRILVCRGGEGGFGNDSFKTPTERSPRIATPGKVGQEKKISLILRLIAHFGLIGLPNAGKSSLLNALTNANVKTASYPFTTLEPNLGVVEGQIIADIPGLIEGASAGKGLGIKFLKHIEKVNLLLHCISVESENIKEDYETVLQEIAKYNKTILTKPTVVLLTKIDLVSPEILKNKIKILQKLNVSIVPISLYESSTLIKLKNILVSKS